MQDAKAAARKSALTKPDLRLICVTVLLQCRNLIVDAENGVDSVWKKATLRQINPGKPEKFAQRFQARETPERP
jgi:hypothetical protein